jgi:aminomethyltransferase
MGYVQSEFSAVDTEVFVDVRDKSLKARVVRMPFVR